jgi:hypothetical protein
LTWHALTEFKTERAERFAHDMITLGIFQVSMDGRSVQARAERTGTFTLADGWMPLTGLMRELELSRAEAVAGVGYLYELGHAEVRLDLGSREFCYRVTGSQAQILAAIRGPGHRGRIAS